MNGKERVSKRACVRTEVCICIYISRSHSDCRERSKVRDEGRVVKKIARFQGKITQTISYSKTCR